MTSKQLLHRNKALLKQWLAVANETWFEELLVYAKAAMVENGASSEDLLGANAFIAVLQDLAIGDPVSVEIPGPGLIADVVGAAKELDLKQKNSKKR